MIGCEFPESPMVGCECNGCLLVAMGCRCADDCRCCCSPYSDGRSCGCPLYVDWLDEDE